jgi:hypothetical protein
MIDAPTLFILGVGAGYPCGFTLGIDLVKQHYYFKSKC